MSKWSKIDLFLSPHLSRIVRSYLQKFSSNIEKVPEHYQLHRTFFATHLNENARKLHQKLLVRCDDNAYETGVALKIIVSSAIIPDKARATPCYFRKVFVGQDNKIEVKDVLKLDGEK